LVVSGPSIAGVETGEVGAAAGAAGAAGGVVVVVVVVVLWARAVTAQRASAEIYRGYSFLFIRIF